jgi:RHS repeat-associated protein
VKKVVPATGETTLFVYDASGKMVAEYSTIVTPPSEAKVSYLTNDHLGSPRILTDQNGQVISRRDFLPFGEEINSGTGGRTTAQGYIGSDSIRQKFTSYERDQETDLDYARARMYGNSLGRFTSPDPLYIEFRRLPFPQAWNLYAYTRNNPLTFIDPDGLEIAVNCKTTKEQVKACQEQTITDLNNRKDAQFKVEIKNGKLAVVGKVDVSKLSKSERKLYNAITDSFGKATLNVVMSSNEITFGRYDRAGQNSVDLSDLSKLNASGNNTLSGEVIAHEAIEGYESSLGLDDPEDPNALFNESHATANQFFGDVTISLPDASGLAGARVSSREATYNFRRLGTLVTVSKKFKTPIPVESITSANFPNLVGDIDKVVVRNTPTQTPAKPKEKP